MASSMSPDSMCVRTSVMTVSIRTLRVAQLEAMNLFVSQLGQAFHRGFEPKRLLPSPVRRMRT